MWWKVKRTIFLFEMLWMLMCHLTGLLLVKLNYYLDEVIPPLAVIDDSFPSQVAQCEVNMLQHEKVHPLDCVYMDVQGDPVHLQVPLGEYLLLAICNLYRQLDISSITHTGWLFLCEYKTVFFCTSDMPIQCNQILAKGTTHYKGHKPAAETSCG